MSSRDERRSAARAARGRRAERYDALFAPWALAASGALASLAFLFQQELALKALLFVLFMAAALASGKKVSLPTTLFVSLGIVAANLIVPVGRVLWRAGPLVVTETALLDGLAKAITFEGLLYISKATIRNGLRLPGRFGAIVASAFVYYDRIVEYRGRIRPGSLFADADALMLEVWDAPRPETTGTEAAKTRPVLGFVLAFGAALFALVLLVIGKLHAR
jgi:hypothetical protein